VIVLMNAENSLDLFSAGRMGKIAEGVTSLLEGRKPAPRPSNIFSFVAYAVLFGLLVVQARAIVRSVRALRSGRRRARWLGPRWRIGLSLVLSLGWAALVLVLAPRQLGLPLLTLAQGLPDIAYLLLASGAVALVWGIARTAWAYAVLRGARRSEPTAQIATS
jgi:hypothetical protein